MLVKLGDQRLDAVVPKLDRATVQRYKQPRTRGVERNALDSCTLRFEERDERRAWSRRHVASPP